MQLREEGMRGAGGRKEPGSVEPGRMGLENVGFAPEMPIFVEVMMEVSA
jgi:hypothetical protein